MLILGIDTNLPSRKKPPLPQGPVGVLIEGPDRVKWIYRARTKRGELILELGPGQKDFCHPSNRPDAVALEWPNYRQGSHTSNPAFAADQARNAAGLLEVVEVITNIADWFAAQGVPVYRIHPQTARTVSSWHTRLGRPYDEYRAEELARQGTDCSSTGLSNPDLVDAFTVAQFAALQKPDALAQYLYRPLWPIGQRHA